MAFVILQPTNTQLLFSKYVVKFQGTSIFLLLSGIYHSQGYFLFLLKVLSVIIWMKQNRNIMNLDFGSFNSMILSSALFILIQPLNKINKKEASLYLMRRKSADKDEVHYDDAAIGNFPLRWWKADKAFVKTLLLSLSDIILSYLILSFLFLSCLTLFDFILSYLTLSYLILSYMILSHWQFPPEMMGGWQSFCEDFLIGPQSGSQTESTML